MYNEQPSLFFKAMMTGLFIGIVDTIICLTYNIIYRNMTGYLPSEFINVSSLIFIVNLLLLVIGIVFYFFTKAFGKKDIVYIVVFLLLTAWCLAEVMAGHRFPDEKLNTGFRGLLGGIILVLGLSASGLPFLVRSRKFEDKLL